MQLVVAIILLIGLSACTTPTKQPLDPAQPKLLLVVVGGNSESIHKDGMREIYGQRETARTMPLVKNLATQLGIEPADVSFHYFSWTGDQEGHKGFLPGHASWITGGSERIQQWLPQLKEPLRPDQRIAIVGWSNGGATAYELSCDISQLNPESVSLLITLDPVSWTTTPCKTTTDQPQRVAKTWVNVYTGSTWIDRFKLSNIIALFGKAWDDNFPTVKADDLLQLEAGNHGDVLDMWNKKALKSEKFTQWK